MKKLLRPKVTIPIILSIAILAALVFFANTPKLIGLMESFQRIYLLWFLVLMVVYETVRGVQWHFLLRSLDIRVPLRAQIFAFAASEVTKIMPIGNYFQNYLLQQSEGTDFGLSSAATTLIILIEVAVSLAGVVIIGLGSWSSWLRPVIIIGAAVCVFLAWVYHTFHHSTRMPRWIREHKRLRQAWGEFVQFREGAGALFQPRILGIATALGTIYVIVGGAALYLVLRGLGIGGLTFWQTLTVYFFSLGFALIIPIPVDVGVVEISAVGAFLAEGLNRNDAVAATLINRALSIGASIAIAVVVMLVLREQFRAAFMGRSRQSSASGSTRPPDDDKPRLSPPPGGKRPPSAGKHPVASHASRPASAPDDEDDDEKPLASGTARKR